MFDHMWFIKMQKYTFIHVSLSISLHISKVRGKNCHQMKRWLMSHLWGSHINDFLDTSFYVYCSVTASFWQQQSQVYRLKQAFKSKAVAKKWQFFSPIINTQSATVHFNLMQVRQRVKQKLIFYNLIKLYKISTYIKL